MLSVLASPAKSNKNLTSAVEVVAATTVNRTTRVVARADLGDGVNDLDGTGGSFVLLVLVAGNTWRGVQAVAAGTTRATLVSEPLPVIDGQGVSVQVLSPNGADTAVAVTAWLLDVADPWGADLVVEDKSGNAAGNLVRRTHALAGGTKASKDHAETDPTWVHRDEADSADLITRTRTVSGDVETITPS